MIITLTSTLHNRIPPRITNHSNNNRISLQKSNLHFQSIIMTSTMASSPSTKIDPISSLSESSTEELESATNTPPIPKTLTENPPTSDVEFWKEHKPSITDDDSKLSHKMKNYDFAFIMRPTKVLKQGIDALSEKLFNKDQHALLLVGLNGFELVVWNYDDIKDNLIFASLRLKASGLEDFECKKAVKKVVCLLGISKVFEAAENFNKDYGSVAVFSQEGSDRLSFQWGNSHLDFALGLPVSVDLIDEEVAFKKFPDVSFIFEAAAPIQFLRTMIEKLKSEVRARPEKVDVSLKPATVQITTSIDVTKTAEEQEEYKVQMTFKYWESLWSAAHMADYYSVYLATVPSESILLRFNLKELGDMVFLNQAKFISVPELPCIGHLRSLN